VALLLVDVVEVVELVVTWVALPVTEARPGADADVVAVAVDGVVA
jgi:hypothetical protein